MGPARNPPGVAVPNTRGLCRYGGRRVVQLGGGFPVATCESERSRSNFVRIFTMWRSGGENRCQSAFPADVKWVLYG
jgi:hypothetical protein